MSKYRRNCLIVSLLCFAVAAFCIIGIADLASADSGKRTIHLKN
jgi:hypothetical protein